MANTKLTGKRALQLLEEVVAEKGVNYLYPEQLCHYIKDDKPSCLVGHVFVRAGLTPECVSQGDGYGSIDADFRLAGLDLTPKAIRVLAAAQSAQDGLPSLTTAHAIPRKTWGEALEEARRVK